MKHTHGARARRPGRSRAGVRADTHSAAPPPPLSATEAGRGPPSPGRRRWRPRRAPRPGPAPARRGRGRSRASRSPRGAGLSARGAPPFWSPLSRSCDSLHLRGGTEGTQGIMSPRCGGAGVVSGVRACRLRLSNPARPGMLPPRGVLRGSSAISL